LSRCPGGEAYAKGNVLVAFEGEACDFDGGLVRSVCEILSGTNGSNKQ